MKFKLDITNQTHNLKETERIELRGDNKDIKSKVQAEWAEGRKITRQPAGRTAIQRALLNASSTAFDLLVEEKNSLSGHVNKSRLQIWFLFRSYFCLN